MSAIQKMLDYVNGKIIKTINNQTIFGEGNIEASGGEGFEPTAEQLEAINSGINTEKVEDIQENKEGINLLNEAIASLELNKLTANGADRGLDVVNNKVGHINLIAEQPTNRFYFCKLDENGHIKEILSSWSYSDDYTVGAANNLLTSKGAKALYDWAKITDTSGGNAVSTTGIDSSLSRTSSAYNSTVSRIMKHCGVASLQYWGQYSSASAISSKFVCIGTISEEYRPVSRVAIQVTTFNATPAGGACGYIDKDGKIYVWVNSIVAGAVNIQFCINANWKIA